MSSKIVSSMPEYLISNSVFSGINKTCNSFDNINNNQFEIHNLIADNILFKDGTFLLNPLPDSELLVYMFIINENPSTIIFDVSVSEAKIADKIVLILKTSEDNRCNVNVSFKNNFYMGDRNKDDGINIGIRNILTFMFDGEVFVYIDSD